MTRRQKRGWVIVYTFAVAGLFIWLGFEGLRFKGFPAQYVGYLIGAMGLAAMFGLNVWIGGPLDRRNDPHEPPDADDMRPPA